MRGISVWVSAFVFLLSPCVGGHLLCFEAELSNTSSSTHFDEFDFSKDPYETAPDLPFDPHHWFINQQPIEKYFARYQVHTAIEVGSWLGGSSRFIASLLPEDGHLYCVDTWEGSSEHHDDPRLSQLYDLFLSNVKHANLTHKITPIRMRSVDAAQKLDLQADFIYIDAAHDTESVIEDILSWYPHLNKGGLLCGDDWGWESVRVAVKHCSSLLRKKVRAFGNFWWYEETSDGNLIFGPQKGKHQRKRP